MTIKAASLSPSVHVMHDDRGLVIYTTDAMGTPAQHVRLGDAEWRALRLFVSELHLTEAESLQAEMERQAAAEPLRPYDPFDPSLPAFLRRQAY